MKAYTTYHVILVLVALVTVGCTFGRQSRTTSLPDYEGKATVSASTATATGAQPVAPVMPEQLLPVVQPPQPVVTRREVGGPYVLASTEIDAKNRWSVVFGNKDRRSFRCVRGPADKHGVPIFRQRRNRAQQNLFHGGPNWNVPCQAVILPNISGSKRHVPVATLAMEAQEGPVEFTFIVESYDYDGVNPPVKVGSDSESFVFPFTHENNGLCNVNREAEDNCLYHWFASISGGGIVAPSFSLAISSSAFADGLLAMR
ncbi:MAG: hypothetical protein WC766_05350 [Patescibacteria group bacterium]